MKCVTDAREKESIRGLIISDTCKESARGERKLTGGSWRNAPFFGSRSKELPELGRWGILARQIEGGDVLGEGAFPQFDSKPRTKGKKKGRGGHSGVKREKLACLRWFLSEFVLDGLAPAVKSNRENECVVHPIKFIISGGVN